MARRVIQGSPKVRSDRTQAGKQAVSVQGAFRYSILSSLITPRFSSFSVVRFSQIAGRSIMTIILLNLARLRPIG
jgi:hypothetical protein